jgi:hypothetical protein
MRLTVVAVIFGMAALVVGVGALTWPAHFGRPSLQSIHYKPDAVLEFSALKRDAQN